MSSIFLSYARKNQEAADALHERLTSWGHQVWMDRHEIQPSDNWVKKIDEALRKSQVLIGLLSKKALQSDNVGNEWLWALKCRRRVILLRLESVDNEQMSHAFVVVHSIDYKADAALGFRELKSTLQDDPGTKSLPHLELSCLAPRAGQWWLGGDSDSEGGALRNRKILLDRVDRYWVSGLLQQAVEEQERFGIQYRLTPNAVLRHVDYPDRSLSADTDFSEVFQQLHSNILILGAPGGGKTILLLQLAKQLLLAARRKPEPPMPLVLDPMPLVLNLPSWARHRGPLADWIVAEAASTYQVPQKIMRHWLEDDALILLFDGLDEVVQKYRDECVAAINVFHRTYRGTRLAVCSRTEDYGKLITKLDLSAAILLEPLSAEQIEGVLSQPGMEAVKAVAAKEPWFREMAGAPFFLNVIRHAYAGKSEAQLRLPTSSEDERRSHLLDTYINQRFNETQGARLIPAQQMRRFLAWLAMKMTERGLTGTIFHIESLQFDWLSQFRYRWIYCLGSRLLFGLTVPAIIWSIGLTLAWLVQFADPKPAGLVIKVRGILPIAAAFSLFTFWFFYLGGYCAATVEWTRSCAGLAPGRWVTRGFELFTGATICMALSVLAFVIPMATSPSPSDMALSRAILPIALILHLIATVVCLGTASIFRFWKLRMEAGYHACVGLFLALVCNILLIWASRRWDSTYILPEALLFVGTQATFFGGFIFVGTHTALSWAISSFKDRIESAERIRWRWNYRAAIAALVVWGSIFISILIWSSEPVNLDAFLYRQRWMVLIFPPLLIGGAACGFRREELVESRLLPNEGVWKSIRSGTLFAVGFGLGGLIVITGSYLTVNQVTPENWSSVVTSGVQMGIVFGAFFASLGVLLGGADVPVKHFFLRFLLSVSERVPWRLPDFLDACARQLLLRRVGGGYLFVHRFFLEHFSRMFAEFTDRNKT